MHAVDHPQSAAARQISVAIVDDHWMVCEGVAAALRDVDGIDLIGAAHTGKGCVHLLEQTNPDVVLMDYDLPDADGASLIADLRVRGITTRVLMLSCHRDPLHIRKAVDAGAVGFLTKNSVSPKSLVKAIRSAAVGRNAFCSDALAQLVRVARHDEPVLQDRLTGREEEIWRLISAGKSNAEIATLLFISEHTVKFHVGNLLRKLGVRSRSEATSLAYRLGFANAGSA